MRLNPVAAGLSGGLVLGIFVFGFTLISVLFGGYGEGYLSQWEALHPGYDVSYLGAVVGFVYAFIEGFVWVYLGVFLYNKFASE